ncbi:MAG: hypothetical protein QW404_03750 [Candidatus Nanoarchaeia archaeon]
MWEVIQSVKSLESMLDRAVKILYKKVGGGCHNYGENSKLGQFKLERVNGLGSPLAIIYQPGEEIQQRWGYEKKVIATIDLKKGTYERAWKEHDEEKYKIPFIVMYDTDMILKKLGLEPKN